jgi:hypothetical protein
MSEKVRKTFVFVLMPFGQEFRDVYELGIVPACDSASAYCERVDEQMFFENILDRIYGQIRQADLIVAEMTGKTPNVFYEVGYAHGLGKRVILVTKNAADIPFDLKQYPHIVYGESIATLKKELQLKIQYSIEHPTSGSPAVSAVDSEMSRAAQHIMNYLKANHFNSVSFVMVRSRINSEYTDDFLRTLIDKNPDIYRRVRMKGGQPGIGMVASC